MRTILFLFGLLFSVAAFGQQQMLLRGAAAGESGILDGYTADAAYCTCWLYSSYSGSLLRVRRDSDGAQQDIGRDGQGLDEAALVSFCSGTNCYIVTWYDQSGNLKNMTAATAARQPKIYDSATGVLTLGGNPAIVYDGVNDNLENLSISIDDPVTIFGVFRLDAASVSYLSGFTKVAQNQLVVFFSSGINMFDGSTLNYPSVTTGTNYTFSALFNEPSSSLYINGASVASGPTGTRFGSDKLYLGAEQGTINFFTGAMSCYVAYNTDQSSNRAAIEAEINAYFSIY